MKRLMTLIFVLALGVGPAAPGDRPSWFVAEAGATFTDRDTRQDGTAPAPYIEREEVHFVSLDVMIERRAGGAWNRARDITRDQIDLLIGGQPTALDSFENWCGSGSEEAGDLASRARSPTGPADVVSHSYILYFDLEQLKLATRHAALRAAQEWARNGVRPSDKVMIVTGGHTLRIVRPMLPSTLHLSEDLEKVKTDFRVSEMWADGEAAR